MIRFKIFGFEVTVTFGFLFVLNILLLIKSPSIGFNAAAACIIHELGHCFAAVILDIRFRCLKLWAGGISIGRDSRMVSYDSEILLLISGPLFNIAFALIYSLTGMHSAAVIHGAIAAFNLLPYSDLDGGCILEALLDRYEKNGRAVQKAAAALTSIVILTIDIFIRPEPDIGSIAAIVMLTVSENIN